MRKTRRQPAVFRDKAVDPAEAPLIMAETRKEIRRLRSRGQEVKVTSGRIHGCNRCRVCTGACPT